MASFFQYSTYKSIKNNKIMKKLFTILGIIALSFALSTTSFAKGTELQVAFLQQTSDQMIIVSFMNDANTELSIKDEKGNEIYSENVNKNGVFSKRYDLSNLDRGTYSIEVDKGDYSSKTTVEVN